MPSEKMGGTCEVSTPTERLDSLKLAIDVFSGENSVHVGPDNIPVVPFEDLPMHEGGAPITPSQYFDYLITVIDSPDDVFKLIQAPIMDWKKDKGGFDQLMSEEITMSSGGGDCDNISWVAKKMLDALGCKKGVDYEARVIGAPGLNHAATLYRDESGQLRSIDQIYHNKNINNVLDVSIIFAEEYKEGNTSFFEVELYSPQLQIRRSIDPNNFKRVAVDMEVVAYGLNQDSFEAQTLLPKDFSDYQDCLVLFPDGGYLRYKKGVLYQRDYPNGMIEHFYPNGKIDQRSHTDGTSEWFNEEGKLIQRKTHEGDMLVYNPVTGKLKQKNFASPQEDGSIIHSYFDDGVMVKSRTFPEDHKLDAVFYWEDGSLRQETFRAKSEPYHIVYYDKSAKAVQAETWQGDRVDLEQE